MKIIYSFYILKNSPFFLEHFFCILKNKNLNFSETEKIINHPNEVKIRKILRHGFFYKNLLFFIKCSECLETYNKHKHIFYIFLGGGGLLPRKICFLSFLHLFCRVNISVWPLLWGKKYVYLKIHFKVFKTNYAIKNNMLTVKSSQVEGGGRE